MKQISLLVSKEVVGNQMRVVGESLSLSSARRECGLVAGDQSAARLARVIIGHEWMPDQAVWQGLPEMTLRKGEQRVAR